METFSPCLALCTIYSSHQIRPCSIFLNNFTFVLILTTRLNTLSLTADHWPKFAYLAHHQGTSFIGSPRLWWRHGNHGTADTSRPCTTNYHYINTTHARERNTPYITDKIGRNAVKGFACFSP